MSEASPDASVSNSATAFLTALATNGIVGGAQFVAFFVVRYWVKAVYEPRTYIPPRQKQAQPVGLNFLSPLWMIIKADPKEVLDKNGVDPYVFLRFMRMLIKAFVPIWVISWIVLLPINSVGNSVTTDLLERFTFGNVMKANQSRYWAHLVLAYLFNGWLIFLIRQEMNVWLGIRQSHLISPSHSKLAQASTVLVTGIPKHLMDEREIEKLFSHLPGGVRRVWLTRDLKDMPDLWERRIKACQVLENAQVELLKLAGKRHLGLEEKVRSLNKKGKPIPEWINDPANPAPADGLLSLADQLVPRKKRPTRRVKPEWLPVPLGIGKKVDSIDWAREEIAATTKLLTEARQKLADDAESPGHATDTYPPLASAFIQFNQQIAAHMARQCVTYNEPYQMNRRFIEQSPSNVIWRNMSLNEYKINIMTIVSWLVFVGVIIAWSPISTFIAGMSNLTDLTGRFKWLSWIEGDGKSKKILQGIVTGVLPPALQVLLIATILPLFLRFLSMTQGSVSKTEIELDLMRRYFIFLIIHVFLLTTLASTLLQSIEPIIKDPTSVVTSLKDKMPQSSTFFITRIMLQLAGTTGTLLQPAALVLYYIRVTLGGGTPRSVFTSRYRMPEVKYGSEFPNITLSACIMIAYMVISPVINIFGALFSICSYLVYKYLFVWVIDQKPQMDTGGLFFPIAIGQLFAGLYIQEICLAALFFFARNEANKASAIPQAILMFVLIGLTFCANWYIKRAYDPMLIPLPLSMAKLSSGSSSRVSRYAGVTQPHPHPPPEIEIEEKSKPRRRPVRSSFSATDPHTPRTEADETEYFAKPGGQGVILARVDDANDPDAFFHPASKEPQRVIWIPEDDLGLARDQVLGNMAAGIRSTAKFASVSAKGKVGISGVPPDDYA